MNHTLMATGALPTAGGVDVPARLLGLVRETYLELNRQSARPVAVDLDTALDRDLGLDSLARVELLMRIERAFGRRLPEALLAQAQTPRDLLAALQLAPDQAAPLARAHSATQEAIHDPADRPVHATTLLEMLDWHVRRHPDRIQLVLLSDMGETPFTYAELLRGARTVAARLQQLGVTPQQTVAIMLPTCADYFFSYFGILLAGAVPVPIYPPTRLSQIEDHVRRHARILANARAQVLITVAEAMPVAHLLEALVPGLRRVITPQHATQGLAAWQPVPVLAGDIAFIQYTSGSTGDPKGVALTHANLLANIRAIGEVLQLTTDDVFVSWLPLYHDMGLIGAWLCSLYTGNRLVVMSPLAFLLRPQDWLWAIHRHHGTHTAAPNFGYELCLRHIREQDIDGLDLSSLRVAANGAEPVGPETVTRFTERFAAHGLQPQAMTPVYGLAESTVALLISRPENMPQVDFVDRVVFEREHRAQPAVYHDPHALRFISCGHPLPGHRVRLVDAAGVEVPDRIEGRLEFQGPSTMAGYYRRPDESRRLIHDGWLDSGDRAYRAEGEIYITGRVKDIIIRGGRNLYPHEIEQAVGELPGVRKGCVVAFGSADPISGTERLVLLAETRESGSQARARLREAVQRRVVDVLGEPADTVVLAPPHTVRKTSSGKLRRAATRELFERGDIGAHSRPVWRQFASLGWNAAALRGRQAASQAGHMAYAAWFWLVFALVAPPAWLAVALAPDPARAWARARVAARLLLRGAGLKLRVRGLEAVPLQAHIVVANHASDLDALMLLAALPAPHRFVAKRELLRNPAVRIFLQRLGTVFVERFDAQRSVADAHHLTELATRGVSLCVFPEGTFRPEPGLLGFHLGPFEAAVQARIAVVPATLQDTRKVLGDGERLPHHHPVQLDFDAPIRAAQAPVEPFTAAVALRDAARAAMSQRLGEKGEGAAVGATP
jgi:1-acyl-sn-glycerol-3-phosphate acyltransferase